MTRLLQSGRFQKQKQKHDPWLTQNKGNVYLIARFDSNDAAIAVYKSEGYGEASSRLESSGVTRGSLKTMKKMQAVRKVRGRGQVVEPGPWVWEGEWQPSKSATSQLRHFDIVKSGGGHAEEYFLADIERILGTVAFPWEIEIYVSRLPCVNSSSNWYSSALSELLPSGCGPKLLKYMKATNPGTRWALYFTELAPSQGASTRGLAVIAGMQELPNVSASQVFV